MPISQVSGDTRDHPLTPFHGGCAVVANQTSVALVAIDGSYHTQPTLLLPVEVDDHLLAWWATVLAMNPVAAEGGPARQLARGALGFKNEADSIRSGSVGNIGFVYTDRARFVRLTRSYYSPGKTRGRHESCVVQELDWQGLTTEKLGAAVKSLLALSPEELHAIRLECS